MTEALKKYMDKLDELPPIVKKTTGDIRELDEKVNIFMKDIKQRTLMYVKNLKKLSRDQKMKAFKEIQSLYKEAEKLADRKVKLAQKMYDLVDDHITEMDKEIASFNEYQIKKYSQEEKKLNDALSTSPESRKRKQPLNLKGEKKKKGADIKAARLAENAAYMENFKPLPITPAVQMPVDPNEPTYCICHQVSFGQMVACDGKNCKLEWFHFQCVGLTEEPTGPWYCDQCKEQKKKKK